MRSDGVVAALRYRIRHPGRVGIVLLVAAAWAPLRLALPLPYGPFRFGEAWLPLGLLLISLLAAPSAWQFTGDDQPLASWRRGLLQSLLWNGLGVLLLTLGAGTLPFAKAGGRPALLFLLFGLLLSTVLGWVRAKREATQPAIVHLPGSSAIGLRIGNELQGAYWDEVQFEGSPVVFHSSYMVGWCAAGSWAPAGKALMVGLGSGSGAVGLLFTFPDLTLTVVELSPEVRKTAEAAFSVLHWLQKEGRLCIVEADAAQYLKQTPDRFALGLGDAYLAKDDNACEMSYLSELLEKCDRYWFNVIGEPGRGALQRMLEGLQSLQRPPLAAYSPNRANPNFQANWLLTDCPHDPGRYAAVELYCGSTNDAVARMQAIYSSCMQENLIGVVAPKG